MIQDVQDLLATTLSESVAFQDFVSAANAAAALAKVYHDVMPAPAGDRYTEVELAALRPSALIYTERYEDVYDATDTCWRASGRLVCKLRRTTPSTGTDSELDIDFREIAGEIIQDLKDVCETAGRLQSRAILAEGPFRSHPTEQKAAGDYQEFELTIDWGLR